MYRPDIEWALRQPGKRGKPISAYAAAKLLNERNIESPRGGRWWGESFKRMARRIGWQARWDNKPSAEFCREHLKWVLRQPGRCGRPISSHAAAALLNKRNIPSPWGGLWWSSTVRRAWKRLGLRDVSRANRGIARLKHHGFATPRA